MSYASFGVAALLAAVGWPCAAQRVPLTVAQAEADGAAFPHVAPPTEAQPAFANHSAVGSSTERKCIDSRSDVPPPLGSWRSGEFVIRTSLAGLRAGKASKVLWMPLHDTGRDKVRVLMRAARLGHPSDSLRLSFPGVARSVGPASQGREFGFPSMVSFPASGRWLVVATTGGDWGCFVLDVAD